MGKKEKQFAIMIVCIILIIIGSLYQSFEKGKGTISFSLEEGISIENETEERR